MSNVEMSHTRRGPWTVRGSRRIYAGEHLSLREDQVLQPNGQPGTYAVVEEPIGFGVVALSEDERVYLVGQHRYAIDQYSWEIATGGAAEQEQPLEGARRELREETGLTAEEWTPLGGVHPNGSTWTAVTHLFLARRLTPGPSHTDSSEDLQIRQVPLSAAVRMCDRSEITHAPSVVALYRTWRLLHGG